MKGCNIILLLVVFVAIKTTYAVPLESFEEVGPTIDVSPTTEEKLKETKRFKVLEFAYDNLRKTIWPQEAITKINDYVQALRRWSEEDQYLQNSKIFGEFEEAVDNCIILLRALKTDPGNCQKQKSLKYNNDKIRSIFQSLNDDHLQYGWTSKYTNLILELREVNRNYFEKFFVQLEEKVKEFINNLNEAEEDENADIIQWHEKFTKETIYVRKEILVIEFMGLFPDERPLVESKCKIRYSNGI
ncbi:uncharacterized protein [Musca autumnalis]|uniref:uncharacterized protein n=1 Tax=Musca autumnalis TaxID=221902 RepID=UPI003CF535F9